MHVFSNFCDLTAYYCSDMQKESPRGEYLVILLFGWDFLSGTQHRVWKVMHQCQILSEMRVGLHCSWSKGVFLFFFRSVGGLPLSQRQSLRHSVSGFFCRGESMPIWIHPINPRKQNEINEGPLSPSSERASNILSSVPMPGEKNRKLFCVCVCVWGGGWQREVSRGSDGNPKAEGLSVALKIQAGLEHGTNMQAMQAMQAMRSCRQCKPCRKCRQCFLPKKCIVCKPFVS